MHPFADSCAPVKFCLRFLFFWLCAAAWAHAATDFDLHRDTFAFSNDTYFQYGVDEQGHLHITRRATPASFSHRCFVLARAVIQFHQFARFDPHLPRVSREEYHRRIKEICRTPVWSRGPTEKIVIPGYADLRSFSVAYEGLLKEDLGNWLPSYLRLGNWRMAMGHFRWGQANAAKWLADSVDRGQLRAIYLARFPHMNHVVVVYAMHREPQGNLSFDVYDSNYPDQPAWVFYRASERSFEYEPRWYFPGGRVNVMRVFISPLH